MSALKYDRERQRDTDTDTNTDTEKTDRQTDRHRQRHRQGIPCPKGCDRTRIIAPYLSVRHSTH